MFSPSFPYPLSGAALYPHFPSILTQSFPVLQSLLSNPVISFADLYRPITQDSLQLSLMLPSLWQTHTWANKS